MSINQSIKLFISKSIIYPRLFLESLCASVSSGAINGSPPLFFPFSVRQLSAFDCILAGGEGYEIQVCSYPCLDVLRQ